MNTDERKRRWKQDTDELYRAIGEFVVKFEYTCHTIQTSIVFLLGRAGLTDQRIAQILLAGLTADPLRGLLQSLVAQTQSLSEKEQAILKNAFDRFQKLTERRNDVVHTTWAVGWGSEDQADFSEAAGMKFHKNKTGAAIKVFRRNTDDFKALSSEAEALSGIFFRLNGCFTFGFAIEKNFVVSADGRVSEPPSEGVSITP